MSQIYTVLGEIEPLDELKGNDVFFRKELDDKDGHRELVIVSIIKANKLDNIVDIYETGKNHIDMELLDIYADEKTLGDMESDIRKAIEQLNAVGIIYIDLKRDNIGYSHMHEKWKIFDFDASGLVDVNDDTTWLMEPPMYYKYKKYSNRLVDKKGLKELDRVILEEFLHTSHQ